MKYIISETRVRKLLDDVIEDRFAGMKFHKGTFGIIGILPYKLCPYLDDCDWSLVYEREDAVGYDRMVLWVYDDDYQYFSSMTPLSDLDIQNAIIDWFYKKTKLKADLVYVQ